MSEVTRNESSGSMRSIESIKPIESMHSISSNETHNLIQDRSKPQLFFISRKSCRLKRFNLALLSREEGVSQLESLGRENRLVKVIYEGNQIFAHVHSRYIDQIEKGGVSSLGEFSPDALSLGDRKITVQTISDQEEQDLLAIVQDLINEILVLEKEEEKTDEIALPFNQNLTTLLRKNHSRPQETSGIATQLLFNQKIKLSLQQLISDCIKRFQEDREEYNKLQEADNKYFRIIRTEILKCIDRTRVNQEEINRKIVK